MNEFFETLCRYLPEIVSAAVALVSAITSFILYKIQDTKIKAVSESLNKAKARETYTICPECGKKVLLKDLNFYLQDGSKDQDLDGKAD